MTLCRRHLVVFGLSFALVFVLAACGKSAPEGRATGKTRLTVFHAGSLTVPFREIADAFEEVNGGIEVQLEAAGSRTCARKISDLGRHADVMGSADYAVINNLLIPEHASWNIRFAANEMSIVYTEDSARADELTAGNWHKILMRPDVAFGRADPNSDPCGYRSVLTVKLAENYYGEEGLAEQMLQKDNKYIRPTETDLLALLETGTIDYIFLYRSLARQHGLKHLLLPDEINLQEEEFADTYSEATVEISGTKPGTTITKRGAPMVYGITVPKNASNPDLGKNFVEFVLSEKGEAIMERNGQPSVVPARSETYGQIPQSLREFAAPASGE